VDETKYRVCEYRNVVAAYRRFLGSTPTYAASASPFIRLLNIADTAILAVKDRRMANRLSRRTRERERVAVVRPGPASIARPPSATPAVP
jgi:hypothetical protein